MKRWAMASVYGVDRTTKAHVNLRSRVHTTLMYLAAERQLDIGKTLKDWKPSAKDSSTDVDGMIKLWKQVKWIP